MVNNNKELFCKVLKEESSYLKEKGFPNGISKKINIYLVYIKFNTLFNRFLIFLQLPPPVLQIYHRDGNRNLPRLKYPAYLLGR